MTTDANKDRVKLLNIAFSEVQTLHGQLVEASTDELEGNHPYFLHEQFLECQETYLELISHFRDHLRSLTPAPPSTPSTGTSSSSITTPARFPRIEIPKFNGNVGDWESFNDQFSSLVISDASLSDVTKLHYLNAALTGPAKQVIQHLALTDANFLIAWDLVKSRYSNIQIIISTHLKTLFSLPKAHAESADSLQSLVDTVTATLRALDHYKCPIDRLSSCMLVHLITARLDTDSAMWWAQHNSHSTEFPSYSELHSFLISRIQMLHTLSPVTKGKMTEKSRNITTHATQVETKQCLACDSQHLLIQCPTFQAWSVTQRIDHLRRLGRCLRCFRKHSENVCKHNRQYPGCKSWHHSLTHSCSSAALPPSSPDVAIALHNSMRYRPSSVLLATATVKVHSLDRSLCVRALLDQGSEATFISENLAQLLRTPRNSCPLTIVVMGPSNATARHTTRIGISAISQCTPTLQVTAIILPVLSKYLPNRDASPTLCSQFDNLHLADRNLSSTAPIDLLIGADLYNEVMLPGLINSISYGPLAQRTIFGWVLSGPSPSSGPSLTVQSHHITLTDLSDQLHRFWEIEAIPSAATLTPDEQACEDHFQATVSRTPNGRFMVRLPFRLQSASRLGESKVSALNSLLRLEQRLQQDDAKSEAYRQFMIEYEALGHIHPVKTTESSTIPFPYFIPHHAVFKPVLGAPLPRLRVVFNASARSSNGVSLNSLLHIGPKLQQDLPAIILRWRQYPHVLTADVIKMYRQILVHPDDTDFQRIFWRSSPQDEVKAYRLGTVTYGTACAPFLALRCLKQLAIQDGKAYPLAQHVLLHQTYVDDCIFGAYSISDVINTRDQLIQLMANAQMKLSKWASSDDTLLPTPSSAEPSSPKALPTSDEQSILGISWFPLHDHFSFKSIPPVSTSYTKRALLSHIARIFDPLGWIAPVVSSAKILLQQLWKCPVGWDDPLPLSFVQQWKTIFLPFHLLPTLTIPRWTGCLHSHQAV